MKIKITLFVVVIGFLIIGIKACYLDNFKTVLKYPIANSKLFISPDSIEISMYFYVKNTTTLAAVIDLQDFKDSIFLENLNVEVYSTDNPKQSIQLTQVSTIVQPTPGSPGGDLEHVDAKTFNDLPLSYKTKRSGGYNSVMFYFKTWQMERTKFYNFKISGKLLYMGQAFDFKRDIKTERKVEYYSYPECCDFINSYSISDSLYVEIYKTYDAGVFGESITYYLTDSIKFRKVIGGHDEHQNLSIQKTDTSVEVYTLESEEITDTLGQKIILLSEVIAKHQYDSVCSHAIPLFGTNLIHCDTCYKNYSSSYRREDGYYLSNDQFKCGNNYLNAVYFTDSSSFRILLGIYDPRFGPPFIAKKNNNNEFIFYETKSSSKEDTVDHKTYKLRELRVGKLEKGCEKN